MSIDDIKQLINDKKYSLVSSNLAIGNVYKIMLSEEEIVNGYEYGYLYLSKGTGIKKHTHTTNIERYLLIDGTLSVDGNIMNKNICLLGEEHNIDIVDKDTIVEYTKVTLDNLDDYNESIFDNVHK